MGCQGRNKSYVRKAEVDPYLKARKILNTPYGWNRAAGRLSRFRRGWSRVQLGAVGRFPYVGNDQVKNLQKVKTHFCAHLAGMYKMHHAVLKPKQPIHNHVAGLYVTQYLEKESKSP